jgi:hypothetical protein
MSGRTAFWTGQLAKRFEEKAGKPKPGWWLLVGAPCFSSGATLQRRGKSRTSIHRALAPASIAV